MTPLKPVTIRPLALAALIIISVSFSGCNNTRGQGLGFGQGGSPFGQFQPRNPNNPNGGPVDLNNLSGDPNQQAQEDEFFRQCEVYQDAAFELAGGCGPLIEELYNPSVEDAPVAQAFQQFIGNCYQRFQIMYEPYCANDLRQRIQGAINSCIETLRAAPWSTIMQEVTNPQTVQSLAVDCVNTIRSLGN